MSALVVGIGNPSRGDDGIGPVVAGRVARLGLPDVEVVVHDEPLGLLEHLTEYDDVVVVDAARTGDRPGTVHVVRVGATPLRSRDPARGSHGLGVVEAVELARALGRLPARLTLVGVEAGAVDHGVTMTPQVQDRVDEAVHVVVEAVRAGAGPASRPA